MESIMMTNQEHLNVALEGEHLELTKLLEMRQISDHYFCALMISVKSGLREAPPTRKPSMSAPSASSLQLLAFTEPAKNNRHVTWD